MSKLIRRLGALEMRVPDPESTLDFLSKSIGFARASDDGWLSVPSGYGVSGSDPVLRIIEGERTEIEAVIFDVTNAAAINEVRSRLDETGVEEDDDDRIRFVDPLGISVICQFPPEPEEVLTLAPVHPHRLGHVNLKVPQALRAGRFYQDILGLKLSESVGDLLVFLRVGTEHHNLGFRSGAEEVGLHHVAFEIGGWSTYKDLCDHLASQGHTVEYGPGRHGPGNNLFVYVVDPSSGLRLELYADMAHVDEDHQPLAWESVDRVRTVNQWGPQPPQSFLD